MNLDELQSVQSRERQASSLQHLRASFYEEAGAFIGELRQERNRTAAAAADPFDSPEVERLTDDIRTAERTVESIYERRVGKVVKLASIAAADMPYDDDGLTSEEERLFVELVDAIERNRECVLSVLDGEAPSLDCTTPDASEPRTDRSATDPTTGTGREPASATDRRPTPPDRPATADEERDPTVGTDVERPVENAAEGLDIGGAMGGDARDDRTAGDPAPAHETDPSATATAEPATDPPDDPVPSRGSEGSQATSTAGDRGSGETTGDDGAEQVERTTVRVTADVGGIFGVDGRSYDLSAEDVVTLPTPNAEGLVSKNAAERLE